VLVMLSFAAAYGLIALGIPAGEAFLIVAVAYVILAVVAILVGRRMMSRLAGLRRTRASVADSLAVLRSGERREGQTIVFAGPKDCGKSFVQNFIITPLLENRSAASLSNRSSFGASKGGIMNSRGSNY